MRLSWWNSAIDSHSSLSSNLLLLGVLGSLNLVRGWWDLHPSFHGLLVSLVESILQASKLSGWLGWHTEVLHKGHSCLFITCEVSSNLCENKSKVFLSLNYSNLSISLDSQLEQGEFCEKVKQSSFSRLLIRVKTVKSSSLPEIQSLDD